MTIHLMVNPEADGWTTARLMMKQTFALNRQRFEQVEPDGGNHASVPKSRREAPITDATLIRHLYTGDTKALGRIYDRYMGLVYGLALRDFNGPTGGGGSDPGDLSHSSSQAILQS